MVSSSRVESSDEDTSSYDSDDDQESEISTDESAEEQEDVDIKKEKIAADVELLRQAVAEMDRIKLRLQFRAIKEQQDGREQRHIEEVAIKEEEIQALKLQVEEYHRQEAARPKLKHVATNTTVDLTHHATQTDEDLSRHLKTNMETQTVQCVQESSSTPSFHDSRSEKSSLQEEKTPNMKDYNQHNSPLSARNSSSDAYSPHDSLDVTIPASNYHSSNHSPTAERLRQRFFNNNQSMEIDLQSDMSAMPTEQERELDAIRALLLDR